MIHPHRVFLSYNVKGISTKVGIFVQHHTEALMDAINKQAIYLIGASNKLALHITYVSPINSYCANINVEGW